MEYKYEMHCHTSPGSFCAKASVEDNLRYYKSLGYDGVFITNHFYNGDKVLDVDITYPKNVERYFIDYKNALALSKEIGIKVFLGIEFTHDFTDFLVYGLTEEFLFAHPEIGKMPIKERLTLFKENGALIIQAHPFRQSEWIPYIRVLPKYIEGIEVINTSISEDENDMANVFADKFHFLKSAGSDNHAGKGRSNLAGLKFSEPLESEQDFIKKFRENKHTIFRL